MLKSKVAMTEILETQILQRKKKIIQKKLFAIHKWNLN